MVAPTQEQVVNLKKYVRPIEDFPRKGILFQDITPLLKEPRMLDLVIEIFYERYKNQSIDAVLGLESRGFLFGTPLALRLGVPFVPVRKHGKLPSQTYSVPYSLEYGEAIIEIHQDALSENQNVIIVDDLVATGGTILAAADLVARCNAKVHEMACLIELEKLGARKKLPTDLFTILTY